MVGAGPNGLAAAVALSRAGRSVLLIEANDRIGGGARTEELTLPGFLHDRCSAIHPLGVASPFFRSLPLGDHGLEWVHPEVAMAHPLEDGTAAVLTRSLDQSAEQMGADSTTWRRESRASELRNRDEVSTSTISERITSSERLVWRD